MSEGCKRNWVKTPNYDFMECKKHPIGHRHEQRCRNKQWSDNFHECTSAWRLISSTPEGFAFIVSWLREEFPVRRQP